MKKDLNILIVEDEPDLREVFSEMLRMLGCDVSEAGNGHQALLGLTSLPTKSIRSAFYKCNTVGNFHSN